MSWSGLDPGGVAERRSGLFGCCSRPGRRSDALALIGAKSLSIVRLEHCVGAALVQGRSRLTGCCSEVIALVKRVSGTRFGGRRSRRAGGRSAGGAAGPDARAGARGALWPWYPADRPKAIASDWMLLEAGCGPGPLPSSRPQDRSDPAPWGGASSRLRPSQAAPRTPDESPCMAARSGVRTTSENT